MPSTTSSENMVQFCINGKQHTVTNKHSASMTLNEFIREVAGLKGTKLTCGEGGCGACAVAVTVAGSGDQAAKTFSINSCLCPLYSVDGWSITTVEGLGNARNGYHPIQQRLIENNGSQCGYCSPGFVMSMYSLLSKNAKPSKEEIESAFDGNICRCTGYRAILTGMKSFAADEKPIDIEDLKPGHCRAMNKPCYDHEKHDVKAAPARTIALHDATWCRPESVADLLKLLAENKGKRVRLVFGNTGSGVFKHDGPFDVFISTRGVAELSAIQKDAKSFSFGANVTLSALIETFDASCNTPGFSYLRALAKHIRQIAGHLVRNGGCWAGNLMMKHKHRDFPSDMFTMLVAAGAKITVAGASGEETLSMEAFFASDMTGKLVKSLQLEPFAEGVHFRSFKMMPRAQNAHAYVNAAFRVQLNANWSISEQPAIVFGGIHPNFVHATKTEEFLKWKKLSDEAVLKEAIAILRSELQPDSHLLLPDPQFRVDLATNLFYKFALGVHPAVPGPHASGAEELKRPVSHGLQDFETHDAEFPAKQPITKLNAIQQASGEATYCTDTPQQHGELCAAYVLSTIARGRLKDIEVGEASKVTGFIRFIGAKDIPAGITNNYVPANPFFPDKAEIFASDAIKYAGQPIGIVIAETQSAADLAASKVKVTYQDVQKPVLSIHEAIEAKDFYPIPLQEKIIGNPKEVFDKSKNVVEGEVAIGEQSHFHMESLCAIVYPTELGVHVLAPTQWPDMQQFGLAQTLGLPMNSVQVTVKRVGGSFGGKLYNTLPVVGACAVAATILGSPVRMYVAFEDFMSLASKRPSMILRYKAAIGDDGRIEAIDLETFQDGGSSMNSMMIAWEMLESIDGAYSFENIRVKPNIVRTNKKDGTVMRGPGPVPAAFFIETVLEHISKQFGRDPLLVKEKNLVSEGSVTVSGDRLEYCSLRRIWTELLEWADIKKRQKDIEAFNKSNEWRKRGLAITPEKYGFSRRGFNMLAFVAIYGKDGTVTITHGGVEIGQGIDTKVGQVAAKTLGIPVDKVRIYHTNTLTAANSMVTGGSVTSEVCCQAVEGACAILNDRIKPIREKFPDLDWIQLVQKCAEMKVDLVAEHQHVADMDCQNPHSYFSYGATAVEMEVDILTGQREILRADMIFDCGESLNPTVDLGQIEGAFVMGLGYYLSERMKYDPESGRLLTNNTWEYKPPTTKDIPIDFRVRLLRDAPNPVGYLRSKASGEPPMCMSCSALFAVRQAVEAFRGAHGKAGYIRCDAPVTVENSLIAAAVSPDLLTYKA